MSSELDSVFGALIGQVAKLNTSGVEMDLAEYENRINFATANPNTAILADISSSMHDYVRGGRTRWHEMKKALNTIYNANNQSIIAFSSIVEEVANPDLIDTPKGSTDLAEAIKYVRLKKSNIGNVIIITDGEPDDEQKALRQAKLFNGTISTIFIGNEDNKNAIEFLSDLANDCAGSSMVHALNKVQNKKLSDTIMLALPKG